MVNRSIRVLAAGALGAFALAASSSVLAQDAAQGPDAAPGSGPGMTHGRRDGAGWRDMMQARRAEKAQALRAVLQLRPDQEAAFQAFKQAMTSQQPMGQERMGQQRMGWRHDVDPAATTTPQRLDMRLSEMDQREARLRQYVAATKQFYAALTPQQQKAFDGLMALGEHHHDFGGHRGERGAG